MQRILPVFVLLTSAFAQQATPPASPIPAISIKTGPMQKMPGYFPLYWEDRSGKLWLEIDKFDTEFLYVDSMPAGMGSNDLGLDRGQIGGSRIVRFERSGPKVLLIQPNYRYRSITIDAAERRAADQSFAQSVLWGFDVQAEEAGRVLVDATQFYLRDVHHIPSTLQRMNQGTFRPDLTRSALYLPRTKNFPKNTEVEATLTFTGENPGGFVRDVTPNPEAITVREHHSFVELPGPGFHPRVFDPRSGYIVSAFTDYAAPLDGRMAQRFILRHRLQKKNPAAALSEAVQPIVYYLDPGAPEPIRSALLEGARWWNQAFEAAGYKDAFRVELLPDGADPMDVRYNLIQWVHRATRGWSYGAAISDPRTGEIIKGQVTLGSLRARQDYMIFEGLLAPYLDGKTIPTELSRVVLARMRQLAAHEVGHTLGLAHNFAASVKDRASVMDYPSPFVKLNAAGVPDLSDAYATGIGAWDKIAIDFGYRDFPAGTDEKKQLDAILRDATTRGFIFISDADARPEGGAHPLAHLWDAGANAVDELNRMLDVRSKALSRFSANTIRDGEPLSNLEDVLVPIYLLHRYQTEAASKVLGGLYYTYAIRGDGQKITERIPGAEQRRALEALLHTIEPAALTLGPNILALIPPRAEGYSRTREDFHNRTGLTFDPIGAAESAASLTVGLILNPQRAARLVQYHAEDPNSPGLGEVIDRLMAVTLRVRLGDGPGAEVQRAVSAVVLYDLMMLAANENAPAEVRAIAMSKLTALNQWAVLDINDTENTRAFITWAAGQVKRFELNPKDIGIPKPAEPPPGQPIGCESN